MKRLEWVVLAGAGVLLSCVMFYPGSLNGDSKWQLEQAVSGRFNAHHPPLMAYLWSWLLPLIKGGGGIFLFHTALFWSGIALLLTDALMTWRGRWTGLLAYAMYLPLSVIFYMLGKDSGMVGAMVLATALLLRLRVRWSDPLFVGLLVVLMYAWHIRHNGYTAVLPYLFVAGYLRPTSKIKTILVGLFLVFVPWTVFQKYVLRPAPGHSEQLPMLFDIVAVSYLTNTNYIPAFYNRSGPPLTLEDVRPAFDPYSDYFLFWPAKNSGARTPGWVQKDHELTALHKEWGRVIIREPRAYLYHRTRLFIKRLGIEREPGWPYWFPWDHEGFVNHHWNGRFVRGVTRWINQHRSWMVFKPWFYLLWLGIQTAIYARIQKRDFWAVGAIVGSVLFYESGCFFMVSSTDFRFSFWMMAASLLMPLLLIKEKMNALKKNVP